VKYRLIKTTKASGTILWVIQRKWLWWWEYVDCYWEEQKALTVLKKLKSGTPEEKKEVVWQ